MTSLLWLLALLLAFGGFTVGWVARTDTNRRYVASREAYRAGQLALALRDRTQELADARAVQLPAPAVVHVHIEMPALHQGWPQPPVIDGQIVRALEVQ